MRAYLQRLIAHIKSAIQGNKERIEEVEQITSTALNDLLEHIGEVEEVTSVSLNDLSFRSTNTEEVSATALHELSDRRNNTNEVTAYALYDHEQRLQECEKGGGGSGSAINVSMFVEYETTYSGSEFYIRCNKGEIKATDQLCFARYINRTGRCHGERWRYKGWITPIARHCPKFTLSYVGYDQRQQKDVWRVGMLPFHGYNSLLSYCYAREIDRELNVNITPKFKDCKCGLYIQRENVRISNYVGFSIAYDSYRDVMSYAIN